MCPEGYTLAKHFLSAVEKADKWVAEMMTPFSTIIRQ